MHEPNELRLNMGWREGLGWKALGAGKGIGDREHGGRKGGGGPARSGVRGEAAGSRGYGLGGV